MKSIVKALIAGGIIIGIGVILLIVALSLNGWKLKGNVDFEMTTYECQSDNKSLDIEIAAGSVKTEFYDGDKIVIEYPKADGFKTSAKEENGTVIFKGPKKKWYKYLFLSYDIPDTVIKLPRDNAYNVKFEINAGSVYLAENGTYDYVEIDMNAGKLSGNNIVCTTLHCEVNAGTVKVGTAQCGSFICDINAGTVKVDCLNADYTDVHVKAGTVGLHFTGREEDYNIQSSVKAGECNLDNRTNTAHGAKWIRVEVNAGKINADFLG